MPESQVKININFPVFGNTLTDCLMLNRDISRKSVSSIRFGPDGNSSPHVTILMGDVECSNVTCLSEIVAKMARTLPSSVAAKFGKPYRETVTGRYIMANVVVPHHMAMWRLALRQALSQYFISESRMSKDLHVTLAVLETPSTTIDSYLAELPELNPSIFSCLDISEAGAKGAKLDVISRLNCRLNFGDS